MWKLVKSELNYRNALLHLGLQVAGVTVFCLIISLFFRLIFSSDVPLTGQEVIDYTIGTIIFSALLTYLVNQMDLVNREYNEKRIKLFSLIPVKRSHVGLARLLTPGLFHIIFILLNVILAVFLALRTGGAEGVENIKFSSFGPESIFIINWYSVSPFIFIYFMWLFKERYGQIFLGLIAALLSGVFCFPMYDGAPLYQINNQGILAIFLSSPWGWWVIVFVSIVVFWISFMHRSSYLK